MRIADEVIAIIAGLAATEAEGVSSMAGNITNELVSKLGMKNLSKGIKIDIKENVVPVCRSWQIIFLSPLPPVSRYFFGTEVYS